MIKTLLLVKIKCVVQVVCQEPDKLHKTLFITTFSLLVDIV